MKLGELQILSGYDGEMKNPHSCWEWNPSHPPHCQSQSWFQNQSAYDGKVKTSCPCWESNPCPPCHSQLLAELQNLSAYDGERKNSCPCWESNPSHPPHSHSLAGPQNRSAYDEVKDICSCVFPCLVILSMPQLLQRFMTHNGHWFWMINWEGSNYDPF